MRIEQIHSAKRESCAFGTPVSLPPSGNATLSASDSYFELRTALLQHLAISLLFSTLTLSPERFAEAEIAPPETDPDVSQMSTCKFKPHPQNAALSRCSLRS